MQNALYGLSRAEMQALVDQVDLALRNHLRWNDILVRTLICRLPFDAAAAADDADHHCEFGKWYFGEAPAVLRSHPDFAAIEIQHRDMHRLAGDLLRASRSPEGVPAESYDRFVQHMGAFRLCLEALARELESTLGNLDPLTGANNRSGMLSWLRSQQALVIRGVLNCALVMIDLDHFKRINDRYGHQAGDVVLAGVARVLIDNIRPYDRLFRYGGEEFLLCLQGADAGEALVLVERLRQEVADTQYATAGGRLRCTASFGVAMMDPDVTVETTITLADKALYAAKAAGRNRVVPWRPEAG